MLPSEIVSEIWAFGWASGCVLANLTCLCNQWWHLLHHSDSSYEHIVLSSFSTDKFCKFCYHDHLFCFCYRDNSLLLPWILYIISLLHLLARQLVRTESVPCDINNPLRYTDLHISQTLPKTNKINKVGLPPLHKQSFIKMRSLVIFSFHFTFSTVQKS